MSSSNNNKTSVFLGGDLSHAEAQRRGEGIGRKERIDRKDWKRVKLGDALKVCHGKCQHSVESKTGKYPILATSGEIGRCDQFLYNKPSVLIGRKGTIDKPQYIDTPFWTIDTLFYTKVADGYSPKFMFYLCQMIDWVALNEASGVPSLSANRIESLEVCVPQDLDKQLRIVKYLDGVESHINTLQALISKYEAIKKATVKLLLTPKEGWQEKSLGDLAFIKTGGRNTQDATASGRYPFFVRSPNVERIDTYSFDGEAILVAGDGVGAGKVFHYINGKHDCHQRVYRIRDFHPEVMGRFIYCVLSEQFPSYMERRNDKASVDSLRLPAFKSFPVFYPDVNEQKRIVTILDSIDDTISELRAQLIKSQSIKQGMMTYFFG